MNVLLHIPQKTLKRCFADEDLRRLCAQHRVVINGGDDPQEMLTLWSQQAPYLDVAVTGWDTPPLTDALLDQAPALKAVLHSAGSVKSLIPASFWQRGIRLASCNGALAVGVAETTLGMIIAGLKGFFPCRQITQEGAWHERAPQAVRELVDVNVGIIGASAVGRHLIRLLEAFEVRVLLTDPYISAEQAAELGAQKVELEELLHRSDVVSLHAPSLPETRRMLRHEHFAMMKDRAIFINTARGSIVDEPALIAELQRGRIFAFLDVTDPEPPTADSPLRRLPNVVLTPHIAGAVTSGCHRQGRLIIQQVSALAEGKNLPGEVDAKRVAIMA